MKASKEVCLGCGKSYPVEVMTDTSSMLGDGFMSVKSGYFCPECMKGKEICCYCGVPKSFEEYTYDNRADEELPVCYECLEELGFVD